MAVKKAKVLRKAKGEYHHGDLKTSLKQAALRLVRDRGPRGFSVNEASRLAGVSVAAPYRHFHDKDALLARESSAMDMSFLSAKYANPLKRLATFENRLSSLKWLICASRETMRITSV